MVRHVPIAPDTFEPWGLDLAGFADEPTWRLATPHNIQRNTPQTESCANCHDNLELFLTTAYMEELVTEGLMVPEEIAANAAIVVDEVPGFN